MPADARDRVVRVADLLDRPGASRRVDLAMPPPDDLELDNATIVDDVRLTGVVESVVDGLLVRGTVATDLDLACARCLTELQQGVDVDVVELFSDPATVEDRDDLDAGYEIGDGTINLDTLLRDALLPAVPYRPLCEADCQGLCAQCGVNRNEQDCACVDETVDARWAALEALRLPDGESG